MKKLIPLILIGLLITGIGAAQAQTAEQPLGFKLQVGLQGYNGDVGNDTFNYSIHDLMIGTGLAAYLGPHLGLALDAQYLPLDAYTGSNLRFKTDDINLNLMLRVKPFKTRLNPYLTAGIGGNFFHDRTNIRKDSHWFAFGIPFGAGINYKLSELVMLNTQIAYHYAFTDKIDNYPLDADETTTGRPRPSLNSHGHDGYLTSSIGLVFNFGGGKKHEESTEEKLLHQSMKNLKAAQNTSNQASHNLRQAKKLNQQTLAALDSLKNARNMSQEKLNKLKADLGDIVNNVHFEYDKAEIIQPDEKPLNSLATILNDFPDLSVSLGAHADKRGSDSYNKKLSQQRGQAVKDYLVNHGIDGSRISISAYGKDRPLMTNSSDMQTQYGQNRAVELTLHYNGDMNGMSNNSGY
jgi:outer membrane protein OmpA-like peptidoglycan-associated protein/opacity protein-like surface antigen